MDLDYYVDTFLWNGEGEHGELGMRLPGEFMQAKSLHFMRTPAGKRALAIALLQAAEAQQARMRG